MSTRRRIASLVALLAVVAGVWMLRLAPGAVPSDETDVAGERRPRAMQTVPTAPDTPPRTATSTAPLPPPDAPLAQVLAPLQQRADQGDRKAACRLAMELLRCERVASWAELEANLGRDEEADYEREGNLEAADGMAAGKIWQIERLQDCRAVPEALKARGAHYLVQAARAGEPEAMLRYADGHHFDPEGRGILAGPSFDEWRREAPGMLRGAIEAGYPDAALYMAFSHESEFGFLASLVPDDRVQAQAYWNLHFRLFGGQSTRRRTGLDAAQQQQARELAARWHRRYFQGRQYRKPLMDTHFFVRHELTPKPPFCGDPAPRP